MPQRIDCHRLDGSRVVVAITDRGDGDFHLDAEPSALRRRRARLVDRPWAVVRQVHGNRVVDARDAGPDVEADAIVTTDSGRPIAVQGADCAPVAFITEAGPIGVAHVGWRGLAAGVVDATIDRLGEEGSVVDRAIVGPAIGVECYAFSDEDLAPLVAAFGEALSGSTSDGLPALDLRAGISAALSARNITDVEHQGGCTACSGKGFSHRADGDRRRLALVAWIDD